MANRNRRGAARSLKNPNDHIKDISDKVLKGIKRSYFTIDSRITFNYIAIYLGLFIVLVIPVLLINHTINQKDHLINLFDILVKSFAVLVFFVANVQWWATRRESSFDKYYDKLSGVNKNLIDWKNFKLENDREAKDISLYDAMIFAELDILEYALVKYKMGYIDKVVVEKALDHFVSCCVYRENFKLSLNRIVGRNSKKSWLIAYLPETYFAVIKILQEMDDPKRPKEFKGRELNSHSNNTKRSIIKSLRARISHFRIFKTT